MRSIALVLAVAWGGSAVADARKVAPKFGRAAGEAFKRAVEAEDDNKIDDAIANYRRSLGLVIHPSTIYNLASVEERAGKIGDAIIDYETYLAIDPRAPDAAKVRAKIVELEKRPAVVTVEIREGLDPPESYVILDGELLNSPGQLVRKKSEPTKFDVKVPRGRHTLELVTVLGHGHQTFDVAPGDRIERELADTDQSCGNIVVMADSMFRISRAYDGYGRLSMPAGRQLLDTSDRERECPAIEVMAPANDDVAYLYVKRTEPATRYSSPKDHCGRHEIIRRTLKF